MALFVNKHQGKGKDDEFYTFKETWESIQQYIPKDKVVWEAFSNNVEFEGQQYLKSICKDVITGTGDFFKCDVPICDCVISNPPFSIKKEVLERLKQLDKPFILILPTLALQTKYMKKLFGDTGDLQVIMPTNKIFFYKFNEDGTKKKYDKLSYYCCFVCYKMNLPNDFILV